MKAMKKDTWGSTDSLEQYFPENHISADEVAIQRFIISFLRKRMPKGLDTMLDFGAGPTVHRMVPFVPYVRNIDIAIAPIAVEVWLSSSSPLEDPYCRGRIKHLSDLGWASCYVLVSRRTRTLLPAVADKIVAIHDAAQRDPTAPREHWVIRGCGELAATFSDDLAHGPLVPAAVSCPHHRPGNKRLPG